MMFKQVLFDDFELMLPQKLVTNDNVRIGCLNVRRGLIKHELAIKELLIMEKLDILFLVETDTKSIKNGSDYQIQGFETILHIKMEDQPRHRGLGEECSTFFRKDARSNPVANFARKEGEIRERNNPAVVAYFIIRM